MYTAARHLYTYEENKSSFVTKQIKLADQTERSNWQIKLAVLFRQD